jgi:hypothetical protein
MFGLPEVKRGLFAAGSGIMLSTRIPLTAALDAKEGDVAYMEKRELVAEPVNPSGAQVRRPRSGHDPCRRPDIC